MKSVEKEPQGKSQRRRHVTRVGEEDPDLALVLRGKAYQLTVSMSFVLSWCQLVGPQLALQQAVPMGGGRRPGHCLPGNDQRAGLQLPGLPVGWGKRTLSVCLCLNEALVRPGPPRIELGNSTAWNLTHLLRTGLLSCPVLRQQQQKPHQLNMAVRDTMVS